MDRRLLLMGMLLFLTGLVLAALPLIATAHEYDYVHAGLYGHEDTDATDTVPHRGNTPQGYRVGAQLSMPTRPLAYFAEYGHTDVLEQFSVGLLYHRPLWFTLDLTAGASVEFEDMTDEHGYGLRGGLRWSPFPRLELSPEIRHEELFEAATSARFTAAYLLRHRLHAEASVQAGDEERYLVGLRYALAPR
jgi:hypothetical protein